MVDYNALKTRAINKEDADLSFFRVSVLQEELGITKKQAKDLKKGITTVKKLKKVEEPTNDNL